MVKKFACKTAGASRSDRALLAQDRDNYHYDTGTNPYRHSGLADINPDRIRPQPLGSN
jgi:hypothetical protein